MTTAVKVHDDAKSRLEELQAEIRLQTGSTVTQQELLSRLIDDAYESREDMIDSFRESSVPLSPAEKEVMRRGRFHSGVETDESDIDDVLYG
jgi:hypothetical protein